jgi:hypothetical protein
MFEAGKSESEGIEDGIRKAKIPPMDYVDRKRIIFTYS